MNWRLKRLGKPGSSRTNCSTHRILRGSADPDSRADELLLEWLNADSAYGFRARRRLETIRSQHQTIEVFDTAQFGKLFRLDGSYMTLPETADRGSDQRTGHDDGRVCVGEAGATRLTASRACTGSAHAAMGKANTTARLVAKAHEPR